MLNAWCLYLECKRDSFVLKMFSKIPWIVWCSPQMNISKQNVNYNFNFFKAAKPINSEFLFVNKNSHRKRSRLDKTHFLMCNLFNGTHINQIVNQLNMNFRRVSRTWASLLGFWIAPLLAPVKSSRFRRVSRIWASSLFFPTVNPECPQWRSTSLR
jgi:hypothetical protein